MNRKEIVVPRASWNDVFSDDTENLLIPVVPCLTKSRKGPATMHLPCPTFLSKEGGEVQKSLTVSYQARCSSLNGGSVSLVFISSQRAIHLFLSNPKIMLSG